MASNAGRITTDDGDYTEGTAAARLYRWFRDNSGQWFSGQEMDVTHYGEHRCRAASTRKSEICSQVDPSVEWIEHDRREGKHWYRHIYTHGQWPPEAATRMAEVKAGEGYPVRGKGVVVPMARRGRKRRAKPAQRTVAPEPRPAPRDLFGDSRPVRPTL